MGNINTLNHQSQLPINFKQIQTQKHSILGDIKHIINTHDQNQYILIQRVFPSSNQYQKCLKNIKNRSKLAKMKHKYHPNQFILEIIDYRTAQYSQFCGKTFKIFIFIKKFNHDLKYLFKQKQKSGSSFTQKQLLQFMLKIVNCLIELYDHNIKPYHLSMQSIIIRNNKFKIIDRQITNHISPIDSLKYRSELRSGTFIAPQMLSQNYQFTSNTSKSDIFTLGILTLELGNMKCLDQVYDYNERKINFTKIQSLITKLNYSQNFKLILKQMVEQFSQQRIGILRLKQSINRINNIQTYDSFNQKMQDSEYKPLQNNKGLIYLGKHPHPNKNIQNLLITQRPTHQRKDSYHRLLNQKADSRNKKSISFHEDISKISQNLKNNRKSSLPRTTIRQTPQVYSQITPQTIRINKNQVQDFSDNRSDAPISPISLHKNEISKSNFDNIGFIINHNSYINSKPLSKRNNKIGGFQYQLNDKLLLNYQLNQNHQQKNNNLNQLKKKQNTEINFLESKQIPKFQQNSNFQAWIEKQKSKLQQFDLNFNKKPFENKINTNANKQTYPGFDFKISQFPSFSVSSKPIIQQLETPKIAKYKEIDLSNSKLKTKSFDRNRFPEETPIKSLQLIQTQRQNKNKIPNSHQKYEKEKVFGRFDFSNGAVYEGEFNSQNQFEGNGVLFFSSGKVFYSGCWKKNQFHGFGILNNIQNEKQIMNSHIVVNYKDFNLNDNNLWTQYEGEFIQDKKHGYGTLYFVNGDKFSGCFVNDSIHGFGTFHQKKAAKTIMGNWNTNIYQQR